MILRIENRVGSGSYADVFRTEDPAVACKVLRASSRTDWTRTAEKIVRHEALAYEMVQSDELLRAHVPRCFGATSVESIVSVDGIDLSEGYVTQAALALEFIEITEEAKFFGIDTTEFPHVQLLIDRFFDRGIDAGDASIVNFSVWESARVFDFLPVGFSDALAGYLMNNASGA